MGLLRRTARARSQARPSREDWAGRGWALPVGFGDEAAVLTRVGTIDSPHAVTVDPRGVVSVGGWSLDWWVGADDRWHLPSAEAGTRQVLVAGAPVVESRLRIPGGDAVHRVFGVRGPAFAGGDEYVVVEIENDTAVPFALALVVRPFSADGRDATAEDLTLAPVEGGAGRDVAQVVVAGSRPLVLLPRRPARSAGAADGSDVVDIVTTGAAPEDLGGSASGGATPTAALIFPVPHRATLRVLLPLGGEPGAHPGYPQGLPEAERVAAGWEVHTRRGVRTEVPDTRLAEGIGISRATLLLAAAASGPGAEVAHQADLVAALDREGFHEEAAELLSTWPDRLAERPVGSAEAEDTLAAVVDHWRLTRDDALIEALLPEIVALSRLGLSSRAAKARTSGADRRARRLWAFAELLAGIGQTDAAQNAARDADDLTHRSGPRGESSPPDRWGDLRELVAHASATWAWPAGPVGGPQFLARVRSLLVEERPGGLALLPSGLGPWWGQGIELHDAPTPFGLLSFAIRWHGDRPALLWELAAHDGVGEVTITAPVVDPSWRTAGRRGDALLAVVPRPADLPSAAPSVIPEGMGHAESVAPRSVLPLIPPSPTPPAPAPGLAPAVAHDTEALEGENGPPGAPPGPPDPTGGSFS